jgi:hypothetical protein
MYGDRGFLAEYPRLRKAKTEASGRLPGTPVQRLPPIAHGDGICATHVAAAIARAHPRTTISTATDTTTTESGGTSHDDNRAPRA